ncbi:hypothetical protein C8J57DRAFT_1589933 [Mycena rebaudengoi]|nr:hypothetical protein C8J57DRAFT_1589933 [Mycena rebaudengoi]
MSHVRCRKCVRRKNSRRAIKSPMTTTMPVSIHSRSGWKYQRFAFTSRIPRPGSFSTPKWIYLTAFTASAWTTSLLGPMDILACIPAGSAGWRNKSGRLKHERTPLILSEEIQTSPLSLLKTSGLRRTILADKLFPMRAAMMPPRPNSHPQRTINNHSSISKKLSVSIREISNSANSNNLLYQQ